MIDVSFCIVSLNARDLLRDCLNSIRKNVQRVSYELVVLDNASVDGTYEMLEKEFPEARLLKTAENEGFTRPTNKTMRQGSGRYLVLLNPDTLILPGAIDGLVEFMETHPQVGICGPKVLNRDGTFQMQCRRGVSRPMAVFGYFSGLWKVFPHSKLLGGYLMNYLDENDVHEVDGVSGSCMLIRREVVEQIGYLDERFFAYQEDADYCLQAQKAGWKVFFVPTFQIIHYGGQGGSKAQPYRTIYEWHRSYFLYYRKNLAGDYFFLFNWLYYMAMLAKLAGSLLVNFFRKEKYTGARKA